MAHKAAVQEERLQAGEEALSSEALLDQLPHIAVRVVYLGGHPHKTMRLKGHIVIEEVEREDGTKEEVLRRQVMEGYTNYDFSSVDSRGRKRKDSLTEDGKRFVMVSHLAHIKAFYEERDTEKQPMFSLRASADVLAVVKRYFASVKQRVNPDSGAAVLQDMGL